MTKRALRPLAIAVFLGLVSACELTPRRTIEEDAPLEMRVLYSMGDPTFDYFDFQNYSVGSVYTATVNPVALPKSTRGHLWHPPETHRYTWTIVYEVELATLPEYDPNLPSNEGQAMLDWTGPEFVQLDPPTLADRWTDMIPIVSGKKVELDGEIRVRNGIKSWMGGTGPAGNMELMLKLAAIEFKHYELRGAMLRYGDFGGDVYLNVDGQAYTADAFSDLVGQNLGGVEVRTVTELSGYAERGYLIVTGNFDSIAIGGEKLFIDDVGLYHEDCLMNPTTSFARPGSAWFSNAVTKKVPSSWDGMHALEIEVAGGGPQDVQKVSLLAVVPHSTDDVAITARIIDDTGQKHERSAVLSAGGSGQTAVHVDFGGDVTIEPGRVYTVAFFHDSPTPLEVHPFKVVEATWVEPSLRFKVNGPYYAADPSQTLVAQQGIIMPIEMTLDCPSP